MRRTDLTAVNKLGVLMRAGRVVLLVDSQSNKCRRAVNGRRQQYWFNRNGRNSLAIAHTHRMLKRDAYRIASQGREDQNECEL